MAEQNTNLTIEGRIFSHGHCYNSTPAHFLPYRHSAFPVASSVDFFKDFRRVSRNAGRSLKNWLAALEIVCTGCKKGKFGKGIRLIDFAVIAPRPS